VGSRIVLAFVGLDLVDADSHLLAADTRHEMDPEQSGCGIFGRAAENVAEPIHSIHL
jgi:hypothetical protein